LARDKAQTSSPAAGSCSVLIIFQALFALLNRVALPQINNSTLQLRRSFSWKQSN
jgi:hypothetical protein